MESIPAATFLVDATECQHTHSLLPNPQDVALLGVCPQPLYPSSFHCYHCAHDCSAARLLGELGVGEGQNQSWPQTTQNTENKI